MFKRYRIPIYKIDFKILEIKYVISKHDLMIAQF
jgi:hypothetical protein